MLANKYNARSWDDLRKEARRLESELDYKLSSYSKLCSTYETNYKFNSPDNLFLGIEQVQTRADEIRSILQQLSDVNDEMSSVVDGTSDSRLHVLARHRDILLENTQEFEKTNSNLGSARDRAQLLNTLGTGHPGSGTGLGGAAAPHIGLDMGGLLRERSGGLTPGSHGTASTGSHASLLQNSIHGSIQNSTALVDALLAQSTSLSGSLGEQRRIFETASEKLLSLGARMPVVNGLINAVRRKKSKDTIVLASVVAVCVLFMLIYALHK